MTRGIYYIENKKNAKKCVGKSINIESRIRIHINCLKRGDFKKENVILLRSWIKEGEDNFIFYILEEVDSSIDLNERETFYIHTLNTKSPKGYNLTNGGEGVEGYKHTKESLEKMTGEKTTHTVKKGKIHLFLGSTVL